MQILLIEDSPDDYFEIKTLLKDYHLLWAQNSDKAIVMANQHNDIKLIIADVTLEKLEKDRLDRYAGINVAAEILAKKTMPVIIMTNHGQEIEYLKKAMEVLDIKSENFFDKEALRTNPWSILKIVEKVIDNYNNKKPLLDSKFLYRKIGISFSDGTRDIRFISASDIAYIIRDTQRRQTKLVFNNGKSEYIDVSMKAICQNICAVHKNFVKLGAGLCVNSNRLVRKNGNSIFIAVDNESHPVRLQLVGTGGADLKFEHIWITTG